MRSLFIAACLGATVLGACAADVRCGAKVTVEDMVARPGTGQVLIAVSHGAGKAPALIAVTSDRKARGIDLEAAPAQAGRPPASQSATLSA